MAKTLTVSKVQAAVSFAFQNDDPLVQAKIAPTIQLALSYANGTAAGQVDQIYAAQTTLAASGSDSLDLTAGTLLDPLNGAVAMARVKLILVFLHPAPAASELRVGAAGTNPFTAWIGGSATAYIPVRNGPKGGLFVHACGDATGWATNASTAHVLKVANADGALGAKHSVLVMGCSV